MIRFLNYLGVSWLFLYPLSTMNIDVIPKWVIGVSLCLCTIWILDAVSFEDNLKLLGFLVTLPFILYITGLPTANANLGMFLGTVFLAVAIPLVMIFLMAQLLPPAED